MYFLTHYRWYAYILNKTLVTFDNMLKSVPTSSKCHKELAFLEPVLRIYIDKKCRSRSTFASGVRLPQCGPAILIRITRLISSEYGPLVGRLRLIHKQVGKKKQFYSDLLDFVPSFPFKKLFLFEISTLFDPSFLLLLLKGHLCRTEIIDLHNPKLHHRERREGSRWLQL